MDIVARDYYKKKCYAIEAIPNVIKYLCMSETCCKSKNCMINGKLLFCIRYSNVLIYEQNIRW